MVDNGSKDDSVSFVNKEFPRVKVVKLDRNYGFAKACNIGARLSSGKILFFINNDTILTPSCINEIVKKFICNKKVGIVQPLILNLTSLDGIHSRNTNESRIPVAIRHSEPIELPYASGVAMAITCAPQNPHDPHILLAKT